MLHRIRIALKVLSGKPVVYAGSRPSTPAVTIYVNNNIPNPSLRRTVPSEGGKARL